MSFVLFSYNILKLFNIKNQINKELEIFIFLKIKSKLVMKNERINISLDKNVEIIKTSITLSNFEIFNLDKRK